MFDFSLESALLWENYWTKYTRSSGTHCNILWPKRCGLNWDMYHASLIWDVFTVLSYNYTWPEWELQTCSLKCLKKKRNKYYWTLQVRSQPWKKMKENARASKLIWFETKWVCLGKHSDGKKFHWNYNCS